MNGVDPFVSIRYRGGPHQREKKVSKETHRGGGNGMVDFMPPPTRCGLGDFLGALGFWPPQGSLFGWYIRSEQAAITIPASTTMSFFIGSCGPVVQRWKTLLNYRQGFVVFPTSVTGTNWRGGEGLRKQHSNTFWGRWSCSLAWNAVDAIVLGGKIGRRRDTSPLLQVLRNGSRMDGATRHGAGYGA